MNDTKPKNHQTNTLPANNIIHTNQISLSLQNINAGIDNSNVSNDTNENGNGKINDNEGKNVDRKYKKVNAFTHRPSK